jgi:hypothetical protein
MLIKDLVKKYLSRGINCIPVKEDKTPAVSWKLYQTRKVTDDVDKLFKEDISNVALVTGKISDNLFLLDFDLKYDLTGDLYERWKRTVPVELLKKLCYNKTKNNGMHVYYQVEQGCNIGKNEKFAQRETTSDEKNNTYLDNLKRGKTKEEAVTVANNDKIRVLIESRGEGGYFLVPPSKGYSYVHGVIGQHVLTKEEHELLVDSCRSFNTYVTPYTDRKQISVDDRFEDMDNPFVNYDHNGDAVALLESHGWKVVYKSGNNVRFKRPGQSSSKDSACYNTDMKIFYVFTTSTEFEPNKGYRPSSIFTMLSCDNDYSLAYDKLIKSGYGKKKENITKKAIHYLWKIIEKSGIVIDDNDKDDVFKYADKLLNNK